jgi:hypothetical protein
MSDYGRPYIDQADRRIAELEAKNARLREALKAANEALQWRMPPDELREVALAKIREVNKL